MLCAIFCSNTVLPAFGGATIKPRWPLPIGAAKSKIRAVKSSVEPLPRSIRKRELACNGVKFSKRILLRETSGLSSFTKSTFSNAK